MAAFCAGCGAALDASSRFCAACGRPRLQGGGEETIAKVIPTRNMPALIGYDCGVFSILACIPLGIAGLILGIMGLRHAWAHPAAYGKVHAWIGIVAGGLFGTLWTALTVASLIGGLRAR